MNTLDMVVSEQQLFDGHVLPSPEALLLLLRNTAIRQRLLSHPSVISVLVAEALRRSGLSCAEVEERLPALIDAEEHAPAELEQHQAGFAHIHSCPWCYDIYALTHEVLAAQKAGQLPRWPQ